MQNMAKSQKSSAYFLGWDNLFCFLLFCVFAGIEPRKGGRPPKSWRLFNSGSFGAQGEKHTGEHKLYNWCCCRISTKICKFQFKFNKMICWLLIIFTWLALDKSKNVGVRNPPFLNLGKRVKIPPPQASGLLHINPCFSSVLRFHFFFIFFPNRLRPQQREQTNEMDFFFKEKEKKTQPFIIHIVSLNAKAGLKELNPLDSSSSASLRRFITVTKASWRNKLLWLVVNEMEIQRVAQ